MSKAYQEAGVQLEAGYESVRLIKKHISRTNRPGMMGNIGSFGGCQLAEPVLEELAAHHLHTVTGTSQRMAAYRLSLS